MTEHAGLQPSPTIRLADPTDIDAMRAVELDAGRRFADIGLDRIAEHAPPAADVLSAYVRDARAWVALELPESTVIGFALASEVDGDAHLDQVSVGVDWGGGGVGRLLIAATVDWALDHGHRAMTLTTFRDVEFNGPWYRRLGFVDVADDRTGPHLAAIRAAERAAGLDELPRTAMRLDLAARPTAS